MGIKVGNQNEMKIRWDAPRMPITDTVEGDQHGKLLRLAFHAREEMPDLSVSRHARWW
jgi:hypothetical protein